MKILFVAFSNSIHTVRWIQQINDQGWDLHLFPSENHGLVHEKLQHVTIHQGIYTKTKKSQSLRQKGLFIPFNPKNLTSYFIQFIFKPIIKLIKPNFEAKRLAKLIKKLKPDIIHSLEIQHSAYLVLSAKEYISSDFPPWIVTNWGSDIYLFAKLKEHQERIKTILSQCQFYSCECERDVKLALNLGFNGKVLPVFPNTGGFELEKLNTLKEKRKPSERKGIMLKGYQGWAGRALFGLRALERCVGLLEGYTIYIYNCEDSVRLAAKLFEEKHNIQVIILDQVQHKEILMHHGKAKISLGLSISDAISTSFLEAMIMGSFPIQSYTSCANEWIEDGESAILVPPEDVEVIEIAIRRTLNNDELVNNAAKINWDIAQKRLEYKYLKNQTLSYYQEVKVFISNISK